MAAREQSQLQDIAGLLRRRALQIVLPAVVFGAVGWSLAQLWPRTYQAQTSLEVRDVAPPVTGRGVDSKMIQRDVDNARWQVKQYERVARVIDKLEWREFKELTDPRDKVEFVRDVINRVSLGFQGGAQRNNYNNAGSVLLTISYQDNDPQRAEQFLNRLREVYVSEVLDRHRTEARKTLDLLRNQLTLAEEKSRLADAASAKLQKETGVSATQQAPGGGRQRDEDQVYVRLNAAHGQLFDAEMKVSQLTAAIEQLKKLIEETPLEAPENLRRAGLTFEAELEAIETAKADQRNRQVGLRPSHTWYKDAEAKIRQLDAKKEELLLAAKAPDSQLRMAPNPVRISLQQQLRDAEIDLSKAKAQASRLEADVEVLRIETAARVEIYRQLRELDRQAQLANLEYQRAGEAYNNQKAMVDFVSSPFANPFEVSELARAPKAPISPNPALFIGGALALGIALGLGSVMVAEFGRNGVRSAAEAARLTGAPVLGVVNRIRTRREKRERAAQRVLVVVSTAAIAASVVWTTWAYQNEPQSLGVSLRTSLDRFRESLR